MQEKIISKYNVQVPRYTSYPTVPYWQAEMPAVHEWTSRLKRMYDASNEQSGISLYVHLPFCESLCTYCGCNKRITVNHGVEKTYIDALLKEWSLYRELFGTTPNIREIHLGGGTPTFFSPEHLQQLIAGLLQQSHVPKDAEFGFEAHPQNTSWQHLETLSQLGFKRLSLGVQDFDPNVQKRINRIQTFEQVREVTENARKLGYTSVNFDLIHGLPQQQPASIQDTIEKVCSLKPDRIAFYSYAHVPWKSPGQRGYSEADLPKGAAKRKLYDLGKSLLLSAEYHEIGMDHFALESDSLYKAMKAKKMHRNFMGYTTADSKVLLGLGTSSISDAWTCMVQNFKTVEQYQECVNQGKLPVFKGHALSSEDVVLRQHILNLICQYETNWQDPQMRTPFLENNQQLLKEMEQDGLVILASDQIEVTEIGKMFIRNVCTAFDARMHVARPEGQVFSQAV